MMVTGTVRAIGSGKNFKGRLQSPEKNKNVPFMEYFVYETRMFRKLYESRFQRMQQNLTMDAFDVSLEILKRNKDRPRSNKQKNAHQSNYLYTMVIYFVLRKNKILHFSLQE